MHSIIPKFINESHHLLLLYACVCASQPRARPELNMTRPSLLYKGMCPHLCAVPAHEPGSLLVCMHLLLGLIGPHVTLPAPHQQFTPDLFLSDARVLPSGVLTAPAHIIKLPAQPSAACRAAVMARCWHRMHTPRQPAGLT